MKSDKKSASGRRPRYMAAMVLGTALSAFGPTPAAVAYAPDTAERAVTDISRYCTACWRNARLHPDCWTDCTQEVFSRLIERVRPDSWDLVLADEGSERREFLRAIDTVKKRTQRSRKFSSCPMDSFTDLCEAHERKLADDLAAVRQAAQEVLSHRQEKIVELSLEGWSVQEIAGELKLPPERVSDEKYKAIRKLRERLVNPSCPA